MPAEPVRIGNLGPTTSGWLHDIGIHTVRDIEAAGVVEVYKRLREAYPHKVTLNALYGLQAAVLDISWLDLTPDLKQQLRDQVEQRR